MGAGYMQSISVPHFRSPVFSELQGPMQDGYGIRQGWIQQSPCLYPASPVVLRICRKGEPLLAPSRIFTARVGTRHRSSRSFDCAQDFACGLRRPQTAQVVKERITSRLPLGARLESTRPRKVRDAPSLIPESHRKGRESISCCRIAVALLSLFT